MRHLSNCGSRQQAAGVPGAVDDAVGDGSASASGSPADNRGLSSGAALLTLPQTPISQPSNYQKTPNLQPSNYRGPHNVSKLVQTDNVRLVSPCSLSPKMRATVKQINVNKAGAVHQWLCKLVSCLLDAGCSCLACSCLTHISSSFCVACLCLCTGNVHFWRTQAVHVVTWCAVAHRCSSNKALFM